MCVYFQTIIFYRMTTNRERNERVGDSFCRGKADQKHTHTQWYFIFFFCLYSFISGFHQKMTFDWPNKGTEWCSHHHFKCFVVRTFWVVFWILFSDFIQIRAEQESIHGAAYGRDDEVMVQFDKCTWVWIAIQICRCIQWFIFIQVCVFFLVVDEVQFNVCERRTSWLDFIFCDWFCMFFFRFGYYLLVFPFEFENLGVNTNVPSQFVIEMKIIFGFEKFDRLIFFFAKNKRF